MKKNEEKPLKYASQEVVKSFDFDFGPHIGYDIAYVRITHASVVFSYTFSIESVK